MNTSTSILHQPPLSLGNGVKEEAVVINNDIFTSIFHYLLKEDRNKIAQPNLIIGENGSGKTTLLNILAALDKPTGGEVFLNMRNILKALQSINAFCRSEIFITIRPTQ